ncbi:S26 family signal peptidase [archaeon]|nr:S26 family signal peptidase [archaeon]
MEKSKKKKSRRNDIIEIVLALFVAWAAYQGIAFATGTSMPLVAVISSSMDHNGLGFDNWWTSNNGFYENLGITKENFMLFPYKNGLSKYDLMVVVKGEPKAGDVVIYQGFGKTIIHRVVSVTDTGYVTKGDNSRTNKVADNYGNPIPKSAFIGKTVVALPVIGFPRTLLFDIFGI